MTQKFHLSPQSTKSFQDNWFLSSVTQVKIKVGSHLFPSGILLRFFVVGKVGNSGKNEDGKLWEMAGKGGEINEKSLKERFSCNWKDRDSKRRVLVQKRPLLTIFQLHP